MTNGRTPPRQVPTLTEVVEITPGDGPGTRLVAPPPPVPVAEAALAPNAAAPATAAPGSSPALSLSVADLPSEEQIVQRVLADLQRQIDLGLEQRLREHLTPMLARLTDELVRGARADLANVLRELVTKSVSIEMARLRGRR